MLTLYSKYNQSGKKSSHFTVKRKKLASHATCSATSYVFQERRTYGYIRHLLVPIHSISLLFLSAAVVWKDGNKRSRALFI